MTAYYKLIWDAYVAWVEALAEAWAKKPYPEVRYLEDD